MQADISLTILRKKNNFQDTRQLSCLKIQIVQGSTEVADMQVDLEGSTPEAVAVVQPLTE